VDVTVAAKGGKVTLRGMVEDEKERKSAAAVAARTAGVTDVTNELRTMRRPRR
jgi:osmotically-inducible protein OsmY